MQTNDYLVFSGINPIVFEIGPISVHWYGLMYAIGFIAAWYLAHRRLPRTRWTQKQLIDLLFWCFLGAVLGGRLGYVFFYQLTFFLNSPLYVFQIWQGGMSFHGGLLGVILTMIWRSKKMDTTFLELGDFIAPLVPIGLGAGRIGNFINAELWGRESTVPWAIIFPNVGEQPRHPSQLYEFVLEGLILFVVLWLYSANQRRTGAISGLFLMSYGIFLFNVEFVREPDAHLGVVTMGLSQGQLLCIPMLITGCYLMWRSREQSISDGAGPIIK